MDGVNRDRNIELDFYRFKETPRGAFPYFDALWSTWLILRKNDLGRMSNDKFTLVRGNLYLAGLHFAILKEEKRFYDYVVWFMDNRLKNTGVKGYAKCETSDIYIPKRKPAKSSPKSIYAE
jgi:hypothetical protein